MNNNERDVINDIGEDLALLALALNDMRGEMERAPYNTADNIESLLLSLNSAIRHAKTASSCLLGLSDSNPSSEVECASGLL